MSVYIHIFAVVSVQSYFLHRNQGIMSSKKKYYVVWAGLVPGIYETWNECKQQITGFPGAKYKSFKTKNEAQTAYSSDYSKSINSKKKSIKGTSKVGIVKKSISVDAACSGNPGVMEYRGVWTSDASEIFRKGPYPNATNNIGEFLALVHILALLKKNKESHLPIYSDSRTAMAWVRKKKANTKHFEKYDNPKLEEVVVRAEKWLKNNKYSNPIMKWNTKAWGEIPADFGRK